MHNGHGRPQGRARGGLLALPPGRLRPAKNGMFLDFFGKIVSFSLFFMQKVGSCPPWKIFALPWKKVCERPCTWDRIWMNCIQLILCP